MPKANSTRDTTTLLPTTSGEKNQGPGRTGASGLTSPAGRTRVLGDSPTTGTTKIEHTEVATTTTGTGLLTTKTKKLGTATGLTLALGLDHPSKRNEKQRNSTSSMINNPTTDLTNSTATKDLSFDQNDY